MNKKFLSVVLFSALMMGTAGTVTSCKDYDDDIQTLEDRVSAVEKLVSELQAEIDGGAVITDVKQTEDGIEIVLSNGKTWPIKNGAPGKDAPVWSIVKDAEGNYWWAKDDVQTEFPARGEKGEPGNGQDAKTIYFYPGTEETGKLHGQEEAGFWVKVTEEKGKEPIYEVQTTKWLPEGTLTAVWNTEDETLTLGNMKDENGNVVEKTISLTTKLKALVFIPELYENGVEADKYKYANGNFIEAETKELTGNVTVGGETLPYKTFNNSAVSWSDIVKGMYYMPSTGVMYYHMNPLNARLTADIRWEFLGATPEFITRSGDAVVIPEIKGVNKSIEGDKLVAKYQILAKDLEEGNIAMPENGEGYISVAALQATLAEDETVTSDYAAIMPMIQGFKAIAYTTASGYTTQETCKTELYKKAKDAIEKPEAVTVQYNGGTINLADLLCIHHLEALGTDVNDLTGEHKNMTLAEVAQLYSLLLQFEDVHYIIGKNETEENAYGELKLTGEFTPCYVDENGKSVIIPEGNTEAIGRSAIGRHPVVLVKLVDADNNVVLAGYIKLAITERGSATAIEIEKGVLPYLCSQEVALTWQDMSGKILEELKMTKDEFTRDYRFVANETYVKDGDNFAKVAGNIYGTIAEVQDPTSTTNSILKWTVSKTNLDEILKTYKVGEEVVLYAKYKPANGDTNYAIYIGFAVSIADKPLTATYGNKVEAYWYPKGVALAERDTVRINVPAPKTGGDVTAYEKDLDEYFWYNDAAEKRQDGIEFTLADVSKEVYGEYWGTNDMKVEYRYIFSEKNIGKKFGSRTLAVNTTQGSNRLYWVKDGEVPAANVNDIALLNATTGVIDYQENAVAKEFLNLFGHSEIAPNQQFAIIEVVATYGDCQIELAPENGSYEFNARFLRPLDIASKEGAKFEDAAANGSTIMIGDLFTAKDWREIAVVEWNAANEKFQGVNDNGVNLYEYYQISKVTLDFNKATCDIDQKGVQRPLPSMVELSVLDWQGNVVALQNGKVEIDVDMPTNINRLNSNRLKYYNNEGNTQAFTIEIPVTVTYAWGDVTAKVSIAVDPTIANR